MKRMLFNATQAEELRVAIVDGQKLIDLDIETIGKEQRKGNIYKGIITRIEPSLEACFVDYGTDRHGFLPFKEVTRNYFQNTGENGRPRIQDALREGMEVIVQVEKDERGNKGAALTTFISLAGRYLVLMPNNPRGGGVSRRIEGDERQELRAVMDQLDAPAGMSLIARTAAIGRNLEELQWDLGFLIQLWQAIETAAQNQHGAFLIYQESSLVIRAIRDYFQPEIGEILIDEQTIFEQARQFMGHVMPANINRVKRYQDSVPLFSRFQIEHQIETAYSRDVPLPSGGAIVIDHTEALVSIDVNSARSTRGADIEETALRTNLEAADEIARQLRLRDLGGLIVIDFIDMESNKNQRDVENRLREALRHDRARVQTSKISRFGLLELSRQRLQPSLGETSHIACPRCHGTGFIRGIESSALHILRIIQEEAMKENTGAVHAQVPVDIATFLLNEKRAEIYAIEAQLNGNIVLIPNIHLETPHYNIQRVRIDDLNQSEEALPSYRMVEMPAEEGYQPKKAQENLSQRQEAVVKTITRSVAPPASPPAKTGSGLLARIGTWFKSLAGEPEPAQSTQPKNKQRKEHRPRQEHFNERRNRSRNERNNERRLQQERTPRQQEVRIRNQPAQNEGKVTEESPTPVTRQSQDRRSHTTPAPATSPAPQAGNVFVPETETSEVKGSSTRRRRQRRDRREGQESHDTERVTAREVSTRVPAPLPVVTEEKVIAPVRAPSTSDTQSAANVQDKAVRADIPQANVPLHTAPELTETVQDGKPAASEQAPEKKPASGVKTAMRVKTTEKVPAETNITVASLPVVQPIESGATLPVLTALEQPETVEAVTAPEAGKTPAPKASTPRRPKAPVRRRPSKKAVEAEEKLVQIETQSVPAAPTKEAAAAPKRPATRRRAKKPATTPTEEAPLQQIETSSQDAGNRGPETVS